VTERKINESEKEVKQYARLRKARSDARLVGKREKRAKAKAEEEAAKGKK
jgi:large subunit ribosomal protein L13e